MPLSTFVYTGAAGVALYAVSRWWVCRIPQGLKLPPGPPGRYLIGNLLDLPKSKEWLTFNRWANEYGDLVYLSLPGTSLLFVNSFELAKELFDKKGNIYSNRYQSTVLNDLIGVDWTIVMQQYGEKWRRYRTYFHQFFNTTAVENYHEVQMKYIKVLLKRLYQSPEDYRTHVRYVTGALILEVTYGIQALSEKDPMIILADDTAQKIGQAGIPGTYLVDIFPILKHVPAWFPGAKFKNELNQIGRQVTQMINEPIDAVKNSLIKGDSRPSVASALIEQFENDSTRPDDYEDVIKHVTGVAYITAIDTSSGVIFHFLYTMLLYPEVQKRAQQELDQVLGSDTLPSFEDAGRLKYVRALIQELLRWNTVLASAIPHVLTVDDVVGSYFIPKGTIVFGNTWTLLRSKCTYGPDADQFKPERFLDEKVPLPDFAFGYGRRACPGRFFGENTIFLAIASILHLFNIVPFEGDNGPELPMDNDFVSGVILQPKPFKCRMIPRSSSALRVLEDLDC